MTNNPALNDKDPLTRPLLEQQHSNRASTMKVEWPESPVPLLVPKGWITCLQRQQGDEEASKCVYKYDVENNLLKLVTLERDEEEVIDILDPEDIVGVTVEIEMTELSGPRVAADTSTGNAPQTDTLSDTQGHAVLTIYAYPREDPNNPHKKESSILGWCGLGKSTPKPRSTYTRPDGEEAAKWGNRCAFHRRFTVLPSEDVGPLNALVKAVKQAAQLPDKRGRALVIINPVSGGRKNAEELYHNVVAILLEQANFEHDLCVTTHARHAKERMAKGYKGDTPEESLDILEYSTLVCMGGDGTLFECLQGIKEREDREEILKKVTVGVIGAGTVSA
jgi:Diacylglycerol kinase catalytic domain